MLLKPKGAHRKIYFISAILLFLSGGGYWYWNKQLKYDLALKEAPEMAVYLSESLTETQEVKLVNEVRGIFAHHCYKCHGSNKQKGMLRLDEKDFVFAGGEDGPVIVPGKPGASELVRRIKLPAGHKEAMPSEGETLSDQDIALITLWIKKGLPGLQVPVNNRPFRWLSWLPGNRLCLRVTKIPLTFG